MFYRMEGYFYPDTYEFYVNDSAGNVTKKLREQFEKKYETVKAKIKNSGMSLNEVMTLASIVQLEAASEDEMPKVASVFLNRLDDPDTYPMLQSDTTTNYIKNVIKTEADNTASIEHYTECYDTYKCKGLPAGPICNPGMAAIKLFLSLRRLTTITSVIILRRAKHSMQRHLMSMRKILLRLDLQRKSNKGLKF